MSIQNRYFSEQIIACFWLSHYIPTSTTWSLAMMARVIFVQILSMPLCSPGTCFWWQHVCDVVIMLFVHATNRTIDNNSLPPCSDWSVYNNITITLYMCMYNDSNNNCVLYSADSMQCSNAPRGSLVWIKEFSDFIWKIRVYCTAWELVVMSSIA